MEEEKPSNLKKLFKAEIYSTIVPVLAGAYFGYCNTQGIPFENESLEQLVKKGPLLMEAGIGTFFGPAYVRDTYDENFLKDNSEPKTIDLVSCGGLSIVGAISGALKGTMGLGLGYAIGSSVGYLIK